MRLRIGYLLFGGEDGYHPAGGADDFIGFFDSVADAQEHVATYKNYDWAHIAALTDHGLRVLQSYGPVSSNHPSPAWTAHEDIHI